MYFICDSVAISGIYYQQLQFTQGDLIMTHKKDNPIFDQKNIVTSSPNILDHIPSAIYIKDLEGRYLYVNFEYISLLNIERQSIYGKKDTEVLPDNIASLSRNFDNKVIKNEKTLSFDESLELTDGIHTYHSTKFPLYNDSGLLYGMCSFSTDITILLQAKEDLAQSKEKFEAIFNNTFQLIGLMTLDGRLIEANKTSLDMIGAKPNDVLGKYFWDTPWWTHSTEYQEQLKIGVNKAAKGESVRFETTHNDLSGIPNYMDFSITPVKNAKGEIIFLIPEGRNISDLKLTQLKLHESESKYRALFDLSSNAMLLLENEVISECNDAAATMLGYDDPQELIGKSAKDISPEFQPDGDHSYTKAKIMMQNAYKFGRHRFEWYHKKPDGTISPVDISLTHIPESGKRILHAIWIDISAQKRAEKEIILLNKDLKARVDTQTKALEFSKDLIEDTQEKLVISEQKAYLSDLLPGISHEINTPMGVSVTTASYLNKTLTQIVKKFKNNELTKSEFLKFLEDAQMASSTVLSNLDRAASLIFSIKDIATDQISESRRMFNLRKYIDEILLSLHNELKKTSHKIVIKCPDALSISSYPGIYSQILTNFIMNSVHHGFCDECIGEIYIDIDVKGTSLFIDYKDNGSGMDEESLSNVFEPFYTTRREEGNSGLGMHIVFNLVTEKLGGTIHAMSHKGKGVHFHIEIPLDAIPN